MEEPKCGFYYLGNGAIGGECGEFCCEVENCLKEEKERGCREETHRASRQAGRKADPRPER